MRLGLTDIADTVRRGTRRKPGNFALLRPTKNAPLQVGNSAGCSAIRGARLEVASSSIVFCTSQVMANVAIAPTLELARAATAERWHQHQEPGKEATVPSAAGNLWGCVHEKTLSS